MAGPRLRCNTFCNIETRARVAFPCNRSWGQTSSTKKTPPLDNARAEMDSVLAGDACEKPGRTWESRQAMRGESRREQQFYRYALNHCHPLLVEFTLFLSVRPILINSPCKILWTSQADVGLRSKILRCPRSQGQRKSSGHFMP